MGEHVPVDVAQRCADFDMKKAGPFGVFLKSIRMEAGGYSVVVNRFLGVARPNRFRVRVMGE